MVIRRAEVARQLQARREWHSLQQQGAVSSSDQPRSGVSFWKANWFVPIVALIAGLVFALVVQLVAKGLGYLFGFHPGLAWLWALIISGMPAGCALVIREELARDSALSQLEAGQRIFTDPSDKALLAKAHRDGLAVIELWPHLLVPGELDVRRVRQHLWNLASVLFDRRQLADTAAELRKASFGVPAGSEMARGLDEKIARADTMRKAADAAVRESARKLAEAADPCRSYRDGQQAIRKARQVSRQAESVLGQVTTAVRAEDTDWSARQVAAILAAYHGLDSDAGAGAQDGV